MNKRSLITIAFVSVVVVAFGGCSKHPELLTDRSSTEAQNMYVYSRPSVPDKEWRKTADGLGVSLYITDDVDGFARQWHDAGDSFKPGLHEIDKAGRGQAIGLVCFFIQNEEFSGSFKPVVSYRVYRPDGTLYGEILNNVAWSKGALSPRTMYLSENLMKINVELDDPVGEYIAEATFKQNRNSEPVVLRRSFEVGSFEVGAFGSPMGLNMFFHRYYLQPRPELIGDAIDYVGEAGIFDKNLETVQNTIAFFTQVFSQNEEWLPKWIETINRQPDSCKDVLSRSVAASANPELMFEGVSPSPALNDLLWGAFFASGDLKHVERIIDHISFMDEREDAYLFSAATSAKWSLAINSRLHPVVMTAVESALESASGPAADDLLDVLNLDPEQLKEETLGILEKQRAKGKWKYKL